MQPVRFRFPIPAKLLAGLVVNLALVVLGFWLMFRAQFGDASSELVAGMAEPRLQAVAERLAAELRERIPDQWGALLEEHHEQMDGIQFSIFDGELQPFSGPLKELPESLLAKVREKLTPHLLSRPERRGGGDRPGSRPPPPPPPPPELDPLGDIFGRERRPMPPDPEPPTMDPSLSSYPKVMDHTTTPPAYWVVVRIPVFKSDRGWLPALLVMKSDTLTAGGLFLDPKPWVYAGVGVLVISALIWLPIAFGLTRSLRRIRTVTGRVADGDFEVPVPDASRHDELGDLGRSVQQMAQRLEGHVSGQRRFLGDIAHELCSPIARMQASLGILQQEGLPQEKNRKYMEKLAAELQHTSALVNELLSFSKASLRGAVELKPLALAPVVALTLQREDVGQSPDEPAVEVHVPEGILIMGDEELLCRALGNLVRNARRYAGQGGPVEIHADRSPGLVRVTVSDRGPGVPAESLPRLLEPFYRPDAARTRESGGVGLGLAIVKSCTEACGGRVEVANREGGGLEVTLRLREAEGRG